MNFLRANDLPMCFFDMCEILAMLEGAEILGFFLAAWPRHRMAQIASMGMVKNMGQKKLVVFNGMNGAWINVGKTMP